ncbi:hypothetical protein Peur_002329 [Populus x canadensis]
MLTNGNKARNCVSCNSSKGKSGLIQAKFHILDPNVFSGIVGKHMEVEEFVVLISKFTLSLLPPNGFNMFTHYPLFRAKFTSFRDLLLT